MDRNIKISIVIPVYNVERYIKDCISCLHQQTYTNFEAIFVDDGSMDSSGKILDLAAKGDERFVVIHKENGGAAEARNYGLDKCSGEYICFIDADDLFDKDYLEILLETALKHNCDIVQCGYQKVQQREVPKTDDKRTTIKNVRIISNVQMLNNIYSSANVDTIVLWNKIYKKALFENVRFPVGIMFEDEVLSAEIAYKATRIGLIDSVLYYYYYNDQGVMHKEYSIRKLDILTALQLRMDFYKENELNDLYQKDSYKYLYKILQNYYQIHQNMADNSKLKKDIMKKYWSKYKESVGFDWTLKRKAAMLFFGMFPLTYSWFRNV